MARITARTPGVLLRHLSADIVEVDLDARRSTTGFHGALSRMRLRLDDIPVRIFNEVPGWRNPESEQHDVVCPDAGTVRCLHRVIIATADAPQAARLLHDAGYSVLTMSLPEPPVAPDAAGDDGAATPSSDRVEDAPANVPDHPPVSFPDVDPLSRCEVCGFRAYVVTAHTANGLTLSWCSHHFDERAKPHDPFIVADSRYLLTADR